ncbi:MAG: ChbG/HpnK family deacetylase [Ruminococcaceae bacterium]|nr:ChbG/HpnK family deacetylase [Oscillospiraceae bacterium]
MIINADDFGYSASVNKAIAECFEKNYINRTTVMVNMPGFSEAVSIAGEKGFFDSVGLHLNLTEGKALSEECAKSELCDENGYFKGIFHIPFISRLYLKKSVRNAIYQEAEAQIKAFLDAGFTLRHIDSHNYTHSYISVYSSIKKLIQKYGFTSTRISRNVAQEGFSLPFKIYKGLFNSLIKKLKVNGKKIYTTDYFCSWQDFLKSDNKDLIRENIEFMTHPDYKGGVLTDNTLPEPHPFCDEETIRKYNLYPEDVSGKKIKLLVCFIQAHIGGAMTSLVNFLNALDTDKYDVDVMFYENDGRYGIKEEINILPQGKVHQSKSISNILKKLCSPSYLAALVRDRYYKKIKKNKRKAVQIMSKEGCKYSRKLSKEYDVAIAYEFTWCMNYVTNMVNAKKKILWHHVEYEKSGMDYKIDKKAMDNADALSFVSEDCMKSYVSNHPEHKDKAYFIPNLLSSDYVRSKGEEYEAELPFEDKEGLIKLVTVARISFEHKGLDRAVKAFSRLKEDGLIENVRWVIIGKGRDREKLDNMIKEYGLEEHIFPIGVKENPIPYLKKFDAFLLPSRHEGKPMVITEGFIMGLVPVVTEYTSAKEQIKDGYDGLVFDNNDEALYKGLKKLLEGPQVLNTLKENVISDDYGNQKEIKVFDELIKKLI